MLLALAIILQQVPTPVPVASVTIVTRGAVSDVLAAIEGALNAALIPVDGARVSVSTAPGTDKPMIRFIGGLAGFLFLNHFGSPVLRPSRRAVASSFLRHSLQVLSSDFPFSTLRQMMTANCQLLWSFQIQTQRGWAEAGVVAQWVAGPGVCDGSSAAFETFPSRTGKSL